MKNYIPFLGYAGLSVLIVGQWWTAPGSDLQRNVFFSGGVMLFVYALCAREPFYIALQALVLFSTALPFLKLATALALCVVAAAVAVAFLWLRRRGELKSALNVIGALGLVSLSIGFGLSLPPYRLIGGLAIFAFCCLPFFGVLVQKRVPVDPRAPPFLFSFLNAVFSWSNYDGTVEFFG